VGLDGVDEVLGVRFALVFDAESVNTEDESGTFCSMAPETGREWHGFVAGGFEFLDELIECDNCCFFQAVHAASDLEIDVTVGSNLDVVVAIVRDLLVNDRRGYSNVLKIVHGGAEKVILYVQAAVASAFVGIGNCAVDVKLRIEHRDGWRACITRVVKLVTASCHADATDFCLLRANIANEIGVGGFSIGRYLGFVNEEESVSACDLVGGRTSNTEPMFEEAAPFVGETVFPVLCVGTPE
jgi:hypothetical protein